MNVKIKIYTLTMLAISSGYAMHAAATPVFTFTEYSGFADDVGKAKYSNRVEADMSLTPTTEPVYSTMSWVGGSHRNKSSLELESITDPSPLLLDTWTTISTLTHNNIVIPGTASWHSQDILGRLIITDWDGDPNVVVDSENAITISLTETKNKRNCAPPNPVGTVCDDYFSLTAGLEDLFFSANDGSEWQAMFRFANLVNAQQIGYTIFTGEGMTSSMDVQVLLTGVKSASRLARVSNLQAVPEPATLGMLGLSLFGLSVVARRRKAID